MNVHEELARISEYELRELIKTLNAVGGAYDFHDYDEAWVNVLDLDEPLRTRVKRAAVAAHGTDVRIITPDVECFGTDLAIGEMTYLTYLIKLQPC